MFSIKVFVKELCCGRLLFLRCIHLNQNKGLLELFPFHGNNCRKMFNMETGTENVDRALMNIVKYKYIMYKYIYLLVVVIRMFLYVLYSFLNYKKIFE